MGFFKDTILTDPFLNYFVGNYIMSVDRIFDVDFIYFDLMLATLWIVLFIKTKQYPAILMGLLASCIYFMVDFGLWYSILGTRHIDAPMDAGLFLFYFSFTYGIIQFGYITVMITPKTNKIFWTILLYGGWIIMALLSQWIAWDDREISISRDMTNGRWIQFAMMIVGLLFVYLASQYSSTFRNIKWYYTVPILFAIGIIVHVALEVPLVIAGIRPFNWNDFLWNSVIEFNSGIGAIYFIYYGVFMVLIKNGVHPSMELNNLQSIDQCQITLPSSICFTYITDVDVCKQVNGKWINGHCLTRSPKNQR